MNRRDSQQGFVLVAAVAAVVLLMIFLPPLLRLVREEVRSSVRRIQWDELNAVGEAGLDRGAWKLGESDRLWLDVSTGSVVANYNFDHVWADLDPSYEYKIKFTSGPQQGEVTVQCRVRSRRHDRKAMKVFEGIYTRQFVDVLTLGEDFDPGTNRFPEVHWGPMKSYGALNFPGGAPLAMDFFPRKFAQGGIGGRDAVRDENNTDRLEYWAYHQGLGERPDVDLPYYVERARNSFVPRDAPGGGTLRQVDGGGVASASAYFLCEEETGAGLNGILFTAGGGNDYRFVNSTTVVMLEHDAGPACRAELDPRVFLSIEALVATGPSADVVFDARDFDNFGATIPFVAPSEYGHPTAATVWDPPGSTDMASRWAAPGRCCYSIDNVGFHGFLLVNDGTLVADLSQDAAIVGAVYARRLKHTASAGHTWSVYGADDVAKHIKVVFAPIRRRLYRELRGVSW